MRQILDPPTMRRKPIDEVICDRLLARIERQHELLREMNEWQFRHY